MKHFIVILALLTTMYSLRADIGVYGLVKRPRMYQFKANTSLAQTLKEAGGHLILANKIFLFRESNKYCSVYTFDSNLLTNHIASNFKIVDDDFIIVVDEADLKSDFPRYISDLILKLNKPCYKVEHSKITQKLP